MQSQRKTREDQIETTSERVKNPDVFFTVRPPNPFGWFLVAKRDGEASQDKGHSQMITGSGDIARLFSLFHDGVIKQYELKQDKFTLEVGIRYLAERISPELKGFHVELEISGPIKFVTWPDHETKESRTLTDLEFIMSTDLQILEAKDDDGTVKVTCAQHAFPSDFIGGDLFVRTQSANVWDVNHTYYSIEYLENLCKSYWEEWSRR